MTGLRKSDRAVAKASLPFIPAQESVKPRANEQLLPMSFLLVFLFSLLLLLSFPSIEAVDVEVKISIGQSEENPSLERRIVENPPTAHPTREIVEEENENSSEFELNAATSIMNLIGPQPPILSDAKSLKDFLTWQKKNRPALNAACGTTFGFGYCKNSKCSSQENGATGFCAGSLQCCVPKTRQRVRYGEIRSSIGPHPASVQQSSGRPQGALETISKQIAHENPKGMNLQTPTSVLGGARA